MINYLKTNTKWYKNKKDENSDDEKDDAFDDWIDKNEEYIDCLFCKDKLLNLNELKDHLLKIHLFDFNDLNQYSFYKQVQIVNFIRTRIKQLKCINCDHDMFDSTSSLNQHLIDEKHSSSLPSKNRWESSEFYQPVIENDLLLRLIDVDDLTDDLETKLVIPE